MTASDRILRAFFFGAVLVCESVPSLAQTSPSHALQDPNLPPSSKTTPVASGSHASMPWQMLTAAAESRNTARRAEALAALGTLGPGPHVLRLFERALADTDPTIRMLAAKTLGDMQSRAAIPALRVALDDETPDVRFAAARSLWTMGDHSGRDVLLHILAGDKPSAPGLIKDELQATKRKLQDPGKLAVYGAKEAATSLFGPAGWGFKVMEQLTQDRSAPTRAMSAALLGPDPSLDALRELEDALCDKNWIVRAAAAQALGASRHRDQIPNLEALLQDDKPAVRYMAAASILRLSRIENAVAANVGSSSRP
jgi:HEAT repeat protein